jgi:hypothetical protein
MGIGAKRLNLLNAEFGHLVIWLSGHLVMLNLVIWLSGHVVMVNLVIWLSGYLVAY